MSTSRFRFSLPTLGAIAIGLLGLSGSPARAQSNDNSINLHYTQLPADDSAFHYVEGARTLGAGEVYAAMVFDHTQNPLELGFPGDSRARSVVRQLSVLDFVLGVGVYDGLSIGVALPVVVDNDGRELLAPDFGTNDTRSGGVGAARVQAEWTFFDTLSREEAEETRQDAGAFEIALSIRPYLTVPTGRARDYLSDQDNPTGGGSLQFELELFGRARLGGTLGIEFVSSSIDIGDLEIEDRLRFGLAFEFHLLKPTSQRPTKVKRESLEDKRDQRVALRALAVLADLDGERSEPERRFLDAYASAFGIDGGSRRALLSSGSVESLRSLAPLQSPLEQSRLQEAASDLLHLGGVTEKERRGYRTLAASHALAELPRTAPSGSWADRARVRHPVAPEDSPETSSPHELSLGVELFGWTDAGQPFHNERERPVEIGVYLRYAHQVGLSLQGGVSRGLTNGIGAPDTRYSLGLGWKF